MSSTSSERHRTVSTLDFTLRGHEIGKDWLRRPKKSGAKQVTHSTSHNLLTLHLFTKHYHYQTVLLRLWFASSFKFFDHGRIEFQGPWHRQHWKTLRPWDFWDFWHLGSWSCTQGSHSQASRFQRIQSIRYLSFAHPSRSPYPSTYMPGCSWAASTWSYHDLWVKGLQGFKHAVKCNIICYDSLQQKANHRPQGRMQ